ncbi:lipid-binding SYLF domain-containing protein [Massilia sp. DWR3-1-1]|uniref:lipid-binding SYLF domain-containing protein n=1 Tax=Massilia sp. DWR3-1-1 TaxID=2804559 RepID=UPI003CEC3EAC
MKTIHSTLLAAVLAVVTALTLPGSAVLAQTSPAAAATQAAPAAATPSATTSRQEAAAAKRVSEAVAVVARMEAVPSMKPLLQTAKGVFIIPTYVRAALGVGATGGAGVLLVKRPDGSWSDPAFYNLGGISVGAQAGAEGGPVALVLNNDVAVSKFMQKTEFSLNANAGLTIINWAKMVQGTAGDGDVVVWTGTEGLFGNVAAVGINGIRYSQNANNAYYRQTVAAQDVIAGKYTNPQSEPLKQTLAKAAAKS